MYKAVAFISFHVFVCLNLSTIRVLYLLTSNFARIKISGANINEVIAAPITTLLLNNVNGIRGRLYNVVHGPCRVSRFNAHKPMLLNSGPKIQAMKAKKKALIKTAPNWILNIRTLRNISNPCRLRNGPIPKINPAVMPLAI